MALALTLTLVTLVIVTVFHVAGQRYLSSSLEKHIISQVSTVLSHQNRHSTELHQQQSVFLLSLIQRISFLSEIHPDAPLSSLLLQGLDRFPSELLYTLSGKEIHLHHISPEGILTKSTSPREIGLDFRKYSLLWKTLSSLPAGRAIIEEPVLSTAEGRLTRYAYYKRKDGSLLEISLTTEEYYIEETLEILRKMPLVTELYLYHYPTLFPGNAETPPLDKGQIEVLQPILKRKEKVLPLKQGLLTREIFLLWRREMADPATGARHLAGKWIVHVRLNTLWIQKALSLFLLALLGVLLVLGFMLSLRGKRGTLRESEPLRKLLQEMESLSEHAGKTPLGPLLPKEKFSSHIVEFDKLSQGFEIMALHIDSSFQEQERALRREQDMARRLNSILDTTVKLTKAVSSESEALFLTALRSAVSLIPEAEYGAITSIEKNICRFRAIHSDGQTKEPNNLVFSHTRKYGEGATLLCAQNYTDTLASSLEENLKKKILEQLPSARQTLVKPLFFGTQCVGELMVSIPENSPGKTFSLDSLRTMEALGNNLTAFLGLEHFINSQDLFQKELLLTITGILETHDAYTQGHSESVALVGSRIARQLGLSKEEVEQTYWAGLVHDIGKILIPKEILNKPTPLSPEEYALIQEHPLLGCTMLSKMERLEKIAPFVLSHHEYWNGKGYPYNLEGEEIPLISRILSVADAWDAMTSNRSYREALSEEVACGEILAGKGTQFDPRVVEAFFSVMKNVSKEEPLS